ncbi:MAG TPA: dienelactone hydrolase family protein [Chloroflexaceae bacterium]|nr:dienelactone hydrolase family protein [Chloroflexaceae bacterium]
MAPTYDAGRLTASGYLAVPPSGVGPGVLVLHAWWGLTPFMRELCDRLAAEGFVALAPDLFGGATAATVEEAQALAEGADSDQVRAAALEGLEALRAHPAVRGDGVAALGFSFGAAWALLLTTLEPAIGAAVVFYGTYPLDFAAARAAYLGHFAPGDPWEPDEAVAELEQVLRDAGREVTFHHYPGAAHWFFERDRPEHLPAAAELAWQRTVAFLRDRLAGGAGA